MCHVIKTNLWLVGEFGVIPIENYLQRLVLIIVRSHRFSYNSDILVEEKIIFDYQIIVEIII